MLKKKLFALGLSLTLALGLITGCGSKNDGPKEDETSKITILYPGDESDRMTEFLNNEFAVKIKEDLNMTIDMVYVPWDQYWEQKDIMLAANEGIDLYWDGLPDLGSIVNKKQAMPLDDLIKEHGKDMLKVMPEEHLAGAMVDGKIYGIPSAYAPSSAMFQLVAVRQDILEAVGMTDLNTAEDLHEFALKAKEQFPEMKGPADIIFKPLTRYFSEEQYHWVASEDIAVFGEESHKVYSYYETEAFQELSKFNRKMTVDGIYSDDLTIKYNERDSRMQTGLYLWVEGSLGKDIEIAETIRTNAPDARMKTYLLAEDKPKYITASGGEVLGIPQTSDNPEGAMKFINWFYASQENYNFAIYGVEGKDFNVVDGKIERISNNDFFYEWMFRNQNYQMFTPEVDESYIEEYKSWDDDAIVSESLGFKFNNENVKQIETNLKEVTGKQLAAVRSGFVDFETEYPKAIQELKAAGIDEYIAEVQRQMDEFLAQKSK